MGAAAAQTGPAPLRATFKDDLVFVEASIDGTRGLFLVDTGATASALDPRFAQAAFVHLGRPREVEGRDGDVGARQAGPVRLDLAGGPSVRIEPVAIDLSQASSAMGEPLAGIVGEDVLGRFEVTLDYRDQQLFIQAPASDPPDAIPLRFDGVPYAHGRAVLAGRSADGEFQIDTGSNTAVEFWRGFSRDRLGGAHGTRDVGLGVDGETVTERGRIDALQIAGRTITDPEVNFADEGRPDDARPDYAGVIGGPAWRGLVLTLDLPGRRMWVR